MSKTAEQVKQFIELTWGEPETNTFPALILQAFEEYEAEIEDMTFQNMADAASRDWMNS